MVYTGAAPANPLGLIGVFDGENPQIFTAKALANISGGAFVYISGTAGNVLTSGANSYSADDLNAVPSILADQVNGLALYNVSSGTSNYVAIARRGGYIVKCSDVVSGGAPITFSSGGVANIFSASAGSGTVPGVGQFCQIGRALCAGDSGGYALISLIL